MSQKQSSPPTKHKIDQFLNSFEKKITIAAPDDLTHKSTEYLAGKTDKEPTTSRFSTVKVSECSEQLRRDFAMLQTEGMVILEDMVTPEELAAIKRDCAQILDNVNKQGDNTFYGMKTRRAYSLLNRTDSLTRLLTSPRINGLVDASFAPNALLSALQLVEILPGEQAQQLHYDQQFLNTHPCRDPGMESYLLNFLLAVDDFTADNGATQYIAGSHMWPAERVPCAEDKVKQVVMKAGSMCVFSGLLWHGGGANNTQKSRTGIIHVYTQPWLRTLENHFLSIPFKRAATFPVDLQARLGYSLHHPFLGQVDFGHPRKKLLELAKL
eukprot:TRINITY_DN11862_c0_g1_i1.p1 TRINITY_DN11862_c0_g1~~TRINITY_DN11862_c0_g1_i1.p1  ORF type:complete len:325 (+),score=49.98 TRINITY_DN11862_c0_g1_i1:61-1035(+)